MLFKTAWWSDFYSMFNVRVLEFSQKVSILTLTDSGT